MGILHVGSRARYDHGHPRVSMWSYPMQPRWPQGYAYPLLPPQPHLQPSQLPQGTAPPQDPWSVAGADPWSIGAAAAAATAAAVAAGTGMSPFPGPGVGPAIQPPTYPAPGTANLGAQSGRTLERARRLALTPYHRRSHPNWLRNPPSREEVA